MGRDGVLPRKVFGHVKPGSTTPTYNFLIIGALTVIGAILLNRFGNAYELSAEMLNFGAFLAFMGVNVAMFWQFTIARRGMHKRNVFMDTILPLIGFVFCAWIWVQLSVLAKIVGGVWFAIGIVYLAIKTRGFRAAPVTIDFSEA